MLLLLKLHPLILSLGDVHQNEPYRSLLSGAPCNKVWYSSAVGVAVGWSELITLLRFQLCNATFDQDSLHRRTGQLVPTLRGPCDTW